MSNAIDLGTLSIGIKTNGVEKSVKDINKAKEAFLNMQKSMGSLEKQGELCRAEYEAEMSAIQKNTNILNRHMQKTKEAAIKREYLAKSIKAQSEKVKLLQKELSELTKAEGESSDAVIEQKTQIAKATKEMNEYVTEMRKATSDEITSGFDKIKSGIKSVTTAALAMGTAIIGALTASAESTREYREDQAKLITAFKQSGFAADVAKKSYADMFAILGEDDRSVEAVNHLAKLCKSEEELSKWSEICAGVSATFGDSLPIEGLTEAANETAKVAKVTGPLADALNWAGVSEDEFNLSLASCNSESERSALITETLLSLYEDAGKEYKEMNKDIIANRDAQRKLQDATAKVGEAIEPVLAQGKQLLAEFLTKVANWVSQNQGKISNFIKKVKEFGEFLIKHRRAIIVMVSGVGAAFLAWNVASMITGVVKSIKAFITVTKAATVAQSAFNVAMDANPAGAVAAAIGLLIGGITAFCATSGEAEEQTDALTDALKENAEAVASVKASRDENIAAGLSEMEHIEDLKDELINLADEKGNVADKDKARAQFILNELNGALDTEYKMTGNIIDNYQDMSKEIDNLVNKKKVSYILEADDEAASEASKQAGQLGKAQMDAAEALDDVNEKIKSNNDKLKECYNQLVEDGKVEANKFDEWLGVLSKMKGAYGEEATKLIHEYETLQTEHQEAVDNLNQATKDVKDNNEILQQAEKDWILYEQGNTQALTSSWEARSFGLKSFNEATEAELKTQVETYGKRYKELIDKIADGEKVDETLFNTVQKTASLAIDQAEISGIAIPEGLREGINKEMPKTAEEAGKRSQELLDIMNGVFDIHSPSKKTEEMGRFLVRGLAEGMEGKTNWFIQKIKEFCGKSLDAFREYFEIHSPSKKTEEFGQFLVQGLAEGIKNDMSAEEALEQKCKNLSSILSDFVSSFSLDSTIAENELKLWKLENPNATPDEIAAAEKMILNRRIKNQAEVVSVTNEAYQKSIELTGENSEESQKLYESLLKEKIAYEELLVAIEDVNKERDESRAKLFEENYKAYTARGEVLLAQAREDKEIRKIRQSAVEQEPKSTPQKSQTTNITQQFYTATVTPSQLRAATVKAMKSQEVLAVL